MAFPRPRGDGEKDEKIRAQQWQRSKLLWASMLILLVVLSAAIYLVSARLPPDSRSRSAPITASNVRSAVTAVNDKVRAVQESIRKEIPVLSDTTIIKQLEAEYKSLDTQVRAIKATGVIMETDPESKRVTALLQDAARKLLVARYGKHSAYRVRLDLEFQPSIPDFATKGKDGSIVIEMAPIDLIPVSVFTFLEVARTWKRGSFHRNAGHVLQAQVDCGVTQSLPFQEYSPQFPHVKGTTGYCGRPSGPCFYVSIQNNSQNHGPGSQQQHNPYEADANFGRVVEGLDDVVPRIHSTPQREWLDKKNEIWIRKMHILIPRDDTNLDAGFVEWRA